MDQRSSMRTDSQMVKLVMWDKKERQGRLKLAHVAY